MSLKGQFEIELLIQNPLPFVNFFVATVLSLLQLQEALNHLKITLWDCTEKMKLTLLRHLFIFTKPWASQTEIHIATVFAQRTIKYLLKIFFSPILFLRKLIDFIQQCWRKFQENEEINEKTFIDLLVYICSIVFLFNLFTLIIYYSYNISSIEVNQMEIFLPLSLIISILIILYVYQSSLFHQKTFSNRKFIEKVYNEAYLKILEINSQPNYTIPSKLPVSKNLTTNFLVIITKIGLFNQT